MPSDAAFIYSPEAQTGTALSPILEAEAPTVAINLPRVAETAAATSANLYDFHQAPEDPPLPPGWTVIGGLFFGLLSWWAIFTYAYPAFVSALNFLFNRGAA